MLEYYAHLITVGIKDLLECWIDPTTEGTLEVTEFYDCDSRIGVTLDGITWLNFNVVYLVVFRCSLWLRRNNFSLSFFRCLGIDIGARRTCGNECFSLLDLFIDDLLEVCKGLGTTKVTSIDKESRCTSCTKLSSKCLVRLNGCLKLTTIKICFELRKVQTKLSGIGL